VNVVEHCFSVYCENRAKGSNTL